MKKTKKALATIAIAGMLSMIPFNALAQSAVPTRIGGFDAAQTAVQIAEQTGWTGTAILASSTSYGMVDALTAGPLASFLKAPILLQDAGNVLNPHTKAELTKLKVKTVYVTSGTAVISQAVLDQLKDLDITVVPLGGVDRFETSVNIANKMVALGANVNKVAVAFGWLNQDALSIAAIAAAQTEPILLTEKDSIPASVKAFLTANADVKTTHVIGGPAVVNETVKAQLPSATRLYGNTAYDTNVAVLKAFDSILKYDNVFLANGETAIDALAGVPLAAKYNAGIVLTKGSTNEGTAYVKSKMTSAGIVTALGGTAVVPEVVRTGTISIAPPPSTGGGGVGGGGAAPIVTTASVSNATELNNALNNLNIASITFVGDIDNTVLALPLTANHSLTINFGVYSLKGNLSIVHGLTGATSLLGTHANSIDGNLTVDTKNASIQNGVKVNGGVNIVDVKIGTWTESADGNTLTITDKDGATITIVGKPGSITVSENAAGVLTFNVEAGAKITSITCNAPVNFNIAAGAEVTDLIIGAKAVGSTITNNGTLTSLKVNAAINLVANVAPSQIVIGAGGSLVITGTDSMNTAKSALQAVIAYAETLKETNYDANNWGTMQQALSAAKLVAADENATLATVTSATTALTNSLNELVIILKIVGTTIQDAQLTDNSLIFSFTNLTKNSGISVSKDAKISLSVGNSGPIGDFILKAGQSNSLFNAPLPTNENLNLTPTNMTAIFDAIKALGSSEKQAILNTVDFAKVLELVQQAGPTTQDAVFQQIGFEDFYEAVKAADPVLKQKILANMTSVIDISISESTPAEASAFKSSVVTAMFPLLSEVEPPLNGDQIAALIGYYGSPTSSLKSLLDTLGLSPEQKISILDQVNYAALFEAVMTDLSPTTRASMFKAVNFTDLFTALKATDDLELKADIAENLFAVMDIIESSDISRVEMLNALVFGADKKDALFHLLENLDGTTNAYVTVEAVLTDDTGVNKTYTIMITK